MSVSGADRERVLLVVDQLNRRVPGGIGSSILGLLKGLTEVAAEHGSASAEAPKEPSVTLYASRVPGRGDTLGATGRRVLHSRLPGPLMTRAWDLGVLDVPSGFDVVHSLSLAAPPARSARAAVTVHDVTWRQVPEVFGTRAGRWHERALRRAASSSAVLVTPSGSVAADLARDGVPSERVRVIPWGSDHLPEPDREAAGRLLERLGVTGEFLLSVGTLEPRKNLGRLFDAYSRARGRFPEPWPLVVAGPAGWGDGASPVDGVVLAGEMPGSALAGIYERARLLAYVPLAEGFGFPPVEAMRAGAPVVASSVPSAGSAAMEVDPLDVESIAEALVKVSTDEESRRGLVEAGRVHTAGLTWAASARAHVELWRSLL